MKIRFVMVAATLLAGQAAVAQDYPRAETFLGYTYTRVNSASNVPAFSANGGGGQVAINANKWLGFVADIGAVHNGNISDVHLDTTLTNFLFGPRLSLRYSRVRPYFNVLFGGARGSTSVNLQAIPTATPLIVPGVPPAAAGLPVSLRAGASQTGFAMTTGGGLDIKINRHVSFRPIGLDYFMTRLQNLRSAEDNNQHHLRYTTGFNFTFGGEKPAEPPPAAPAMRTCWNGSTVPVGAECPKRTMELNLSASSTELCPGASATIGGSAVPSGANYQWTIDGQPISKAATLEFGAAGREAGSYRVALTVSAPEYNDVTAEKTITVRAYAPPSGTVEVTPAEIEAGQHATVRVNAAPGQCGSTLLPPVFTVSEGAIRANQFDSTGVAFDPSSRAEQRKSVMIVARVADAKGSSTLQGSVVVKKPADIMARRLPDIIFPSGSARVNNCGKRVLLEELKTAIAADSSGKVVLVGHTSAKEAGKSGLDRQRALNAAAVLSAGSGVCTAFPASQILVEAAGAVDNGVAFQSNFCGSTQELPGSSVKESETDAKVRRVEVWFVPSGGTLPASLKDYRDAASLSVAKLGCPR
jgi:outer membrane protein OmpA-like peptidoglycan-associated protein